MPWLRNIFLYPVEAINGIKTNVWSVLLITIGSVLVLHGKSEVGGSLVTGGFALLRTETSTAASQPTELKQLPVTVPNAPKE